MTNPLPNKPLTVRDIAHARAGDKGNTSNVNVWAYDAEHFELLKKNVTAERIKREYPLLVRGGVECYVLEHLQGINLVMRDALEGGVNASLNLDSHGKSWSYLILDLALDVPGLQNDYVGQHDFEKNDPTRCHGRTSGVGGSRSRSAR